MARIRTVKPEFWTSEQVADCSPTARLMFLGLWNFCDDAGRHPCSLKRIKMEIFPADDLSLNDIGNLIDELIEARLIQFYVVSGQGLLQVTGWHHQKIEKRTIKYPEPPKFDDHTPIKRRATDDRLTPECSVMESTGVEGSLPPKAPPQKRRKRGSNVEDSPEFSEFWNLYPRREGKGEARKAFDRASKRVPAATILNAVREFAPSPRGQAGDKCPHPATWLNQERWADDRAAWQDGGDRKRQAVGTLFDGRDHSDDPNYGRI